MTAPTRPPLTASWETGARTETETTSASSTGAVRSGPDPNVEVHPVAPPRREPAQTEMPLNAKVGDKENMRPY